MCAYMGPCGLMDPDELMCSWGLVRGKGLGFGSYDVGCMALLFEKRSLRGGAHPPQDRISRCSALTVLACIADDWSAAISNHHYHHKAFPGHIQEAGGPYAQTLC